MKCFMLKAVMPVIMLLVATSQLPAITLGLYLSSTNPNATSSPCNGGGLATTTTHRDHYQNGYVDVTTTQPCPPAGPTTTRDTVIIIAQKVNINVSNGDIVAEVTSGSIEVYDARDAHEGNPYSTPLIGTYESNGNNIIAKCVQRNVPLVVIVKDEKGNIISTKKILISE